MATVTSPPASSPSRLTAGPFPSRRDTSVFDAARINGIPIPTLCHLQNETPVGVCRLCVVDTGARVLTASCVRPVEPGMKVETQSPKVLNARKTHPRTC